MKEHRPDDSRFLESYDASEFSRPSLTVDVAIATVNEGRLEVLLIKRSEAPEQGLWALPGGFVGMEESLEDAALRVLKNKAGLEGVYLEQLYTFGAPARDPRTRIISVGYFALVEHGRLQAAAESASGSESTCLAELHVPWPSECHESKFGPLTLRHDKRELSLAFDHPEQLTLLVDRLRGKLNYGALSFQLLPELFTLRQLQDVHEAVLGRPLNKDSFRRRMLASKLVTATGEHEVDVLHRPAELHRFIHNANS